MFKNQPRGLYVLALANTGERFGYYTVVSVLLYYLQAKFGFSNEFAGQVIGLFMAFIYFMPLVGGWIADRWSFSKCVTLGLLVMGVGYLVIALPTPMRTSLSVQVLVVGMVLVGLGSGLFKSNLQVMIGDLYNDPKYASQRDAAFSIFYMAINFGAMFAPAMASYMNDLALSAHSLIYNGHVADICNQVLAGNGDALAMLPQVAFEAGMKCTPINATAFAETYVSALSTGYGYSFGVAFVSIVVSYIIYFFGRRTYAHIVDSGSASKTTTEVKAPELTPYQTRRRLVALFMVFAVVIFFWMVFMQNSLTLSEFAKSCTNPQPGGWTRIGFNVWALLFIAAGVYAAFSIFDKIREKRGIHAMTWQIVVLVCVVGALGYLYATTPDPLANVQPQDYQQFNGFYIVALTPASLAFFSWLARRGAEPSAPRKIGFGMLVAALAYGVMLIGSLGINGTTASVSSNWLISTYLLLTIAELLLSPMGISFVSKVAPPKYKGSMMGCWFVSTAIGNYLISIPMMLWGKIPVWAIWAILSCACLLPAAIMFLMMRRLEMATAE